MKMLRVLTSYFVCDKRLGGGVVFKAWERKTADEWINHRVGETGNFYVITIYL